MSTTFGAVAAAACRTPPAPTPLVTATTPRTRAAAILRKMTLPSEVGRGEARRSVAMTRPHARDAGSQPQSRHRQAGLGLFGVARVQTARQECGRDGCRAVLLGTAIRESG